MPTNEQPSRPPVSREEQEEVARKIRAAADVLAPAVNTLREQGYHLDYTANDEEDVITLRLVVHSKWPTT